MMIAGTTYLRAGIMKGAMLIADSSLTPKDGSLPIFAVDGEFRIRRYRTYPQSHLENPENGMRGSSPSMDEDSDSSQPAFWVITYSINDARGEFDDVTVMLWGI